MTTTAQTRSVGAISVLTVLVSEDQYKSLLGTALLIPRLFINGAQSVAVQPSFGRLATSRTALHTGEQSRTTLIIATPRSRNENDWTVFPAKATGSSTTNTIVLYGPETWLLAINGRCAALRMGTEAGQSLSDLTGGTLDERKLLLLSRNLASNRLHSPCGTLYRTTDVLQVGTMGAR